MKRFIAVLLVLTMLIGMAPAVFAAEVSFVDVPRDAWYYDAVQWAVDEGITGGTGPDTFSPDAACTRGQVVMFLWAAAGRPEPVGTVNSFGDVHESDYFCKAVLWAVENGITGGIGDGLFGPHQPCTRSQVVTFLYAAAGKPAVGNAESSFADVSKSDWFCNSVLWAVENNITGGIGHGLFGPDQTCTRGQIVVFLYKASTVGGEEEPVVTPAPTPEVTPAPASEGSGYAVCDLELTGSEPRALRALLSVEEACTLVLEVYTEDGGERLEQITVPVDAMPEPGTVEFPLQLSDPLPDYFLLRAVLQDGEGNPLCAMFESRDYTAAFERFSRKTEGDYPADRVIDLVAEDDGNFALLHDEVQRMQQTESVNILRSRENGICVFEQADDVLSAMQKGDKLLITTADGQYAGIIIEDIAVGADGVVEIRERSDATLSDFYALVKIDAELAGQPESGVVQLRETACASGNGLKPGAQFLDEIDLGAAVSNSIETPFGTLGTLLSAGAKLEFVYDPEELGWNYMEYTLLVGLVGELELTIAPNVEKTGEIVLGSMKLAGLDKIAEIPAELSMGYEVTCMSGGSVKVELETATGFVYKTGSGTQRVNYKDAVQKEFNIKTGFELKFGVGVSVKARFFDNMLKASLGAELGLRAEGELKALGSALPGTENYHACLQCIDGQLKGYFEIDIKASYKITDMLQGDVLDLDLLYLTWNIGRFYLSIISADDGVFSGVPQWGMGECPNRKYLVTVEAYRNGEQVNALAKLSKNDGVFGGAGTVICEKQTPYGEYLYPGEYYAYTAIGMQHDEERFHVTDGDRVVALEVKDPVLRGSVLPSDELTYLSGAVITVERDGEEICTLISDDYGAFSVTLEPGTYTVTCSAKDYYSQTETLKLIDDSDLTFMLEKKEPGSVTGTVTAEKPVSGAEKPLVICHGTASVYGEDGEILGTVSLAETNGEFAFELPMGSYTLKVTAAEYDAYETTFTVGSEDVVLRVVLSPAGTNEEAYAAYVPVVERAIRDANDSLSDSAGDNDLSQGYLADLDGDGVDEMLMYFRYNGYPVYSLYDYEDGGLVTVVNRKKLIQAVAGGDLGSAAIVSFDGKPTVMIMDLIGDGGGAGVTHLYNYEFYDYPSMEKKHVLGYWQVEGEIDIAEEKYYVNDTEVSKSSFLRELDRCEDMELSREGYDFYTGDPMSLLELLEAVRGPVVVKGRVYESKFVNGVKTELPIPFAEIKLWDEEGFVVETIYADEAGSFEVTLTEGYGCDGKISADGYIPKTTSFSVYDEDSEVSIMLVPNDYEAVAQAFVDRHGYQYMAANQRECSGGILYDLNGDGQDELFLCARLKEGRFYKFTYELWTIADGEAVQLLQYAPEDSGGYLSLVEYNGSRYLVIEEVSAGSMAADHKLYYYHTGDVPYELRMELAYWELYDESEGTYSIDGQEVGAAEFKQRMAQITTEFAFFDEWGDGFDGYPLYELAYQEVG